MFTLHQRWSRLGLCVALGAFCARAAAQAPAQPSESDTARAREAFQAGKNAFEQEYYEEALQEFDASDHAIASPNTKLMIGRCLARLDRPAEAYREFALLIQQAHASPDGRYDQAARAAADEQLALKPRVALLTVRVNDETGAAALTAAGRAIPREAWNEPIALEPGTFEVALTGTAGQRDSHQLALQAGSSATLDLAIGAQAPPAAEREPAPLPGTPLTPPASDRAASASRQPSSLRTWSYVAGAAGMLGLASFVVFGALSSAEFSDLEQGCPDRSACSPSLRTHQTRGQSYQTVANVSLGVGVAALGASVALWILGAPENFGRGGGGPDRSCRARCVLTLTRAWLSCCCCPAAPVTSDCSCLLPEATAARACQRPMARDSMQRSPADWACLGRRRLACERLPADAGGSGAPHSGGRGSGMDGAVAASPDGGDASPPDPAVHHGLERHASRFR